MSENTMETTVLIGTDNEATPEHFMKDAVREFTRLSESRDMTFREEDIKHRRVESPGTVGGIETFGRDAIVFRVEAIPKD